MRLTPFDVAFGPEAETWFPRIRASLAAGGLDPHDAEAFILDREVVTYLRELIPEEGVGAAVAQHVALLHHAYLYWEEGGWIFRLTRKGAQRVLLPQPAEESAAGALSAPPRAYYVQFPERVVWAELEPGEPHQPLDGAFIRPWPTGGYFVLAIFGMHPGQAGFTVVDADGYPEGPPLREDGSARFAPILPGGQAAGLSSIVGGEELLELAARTVPLVREARDGAAATHQAHQIVEIG